MRLNNKNTKQNYVIILITSLIIVSAVVAVIYGRVEGLSFMELMRHILDNLIF